VKIILDTFYSSQEITWIVLKGKFLKKRISAENFFRLASWNIHNIIIEYKKTLILRSEEIARKIRIPVRQIFS